MDRLLNLRARQDDYENAFDHVLTPDDVEDEGVEGEDITNDDGLCARLLNSHEARIIALHCVHNHHRLSLSGATGAVLDKLGLRRKTFNCDIHHIRLTNLGRFAASRDTSFTRLLINFPPLTMTAGGATFK